MTSVKGLERDFEYYLEMASIATIYQTDVPFLQSHLIKSKEAANRPKDQIDLAELYKIRSIIEGGHNN